MNIEMPDAGAAIEAAQQQFDAFFKLDPQEEAMLEDLFRDIDIQRAGRWYGFPSPLWEVPRAHYYRCGRAGDPRAEALAHAMRMIRWKDAPPSIRCYGYEADFVNGGKGLYLVCTDEGHQIWNAWRERQRRKKNRRAEDEAKSIISDAVGQTKAIVEDISATPTRSQAVLDARRELHEKRAAKTRQQRG